MLAQSVLLSTLLALVVPAGADTRIADAAMDGDISAVQSLLRQGVDVNAVQADGTTAVHWAAYRDDLSMTQLLIKAGASVVMKTRNGDITPLHMAAKNGNAAVVNLLLKAGGNVNATNASGTTPLMLAAAAGESEAVKVLLDNGADAEAKDATQGQTALMFAAALNRSHAVTTLAQRGANLNTVSRVMEAYKKEGGRQRRQNPNRAAAEEEVSVVGGLTALHFAAREGHMETVVALVSGGADINRVAASDRMSVMTTAIFNAHFDIARFLLDHGADPKSVSAHGLTALFATIDARWAARTWYPAPSVAEERTNYLDLMKEILAKGADPNVKMGPKLWFRSLYGDWVDPVGATAFWRAAQANDVPAMRILVAAGANPNIGTNLGCSPLMVAAGWGVESQVTNFKPESRLETIKYLVDELGADVNSKDNKGYSVLHAAALAFGNNEIIQYLVSKGADVKARANMAFAKSDGVQDTEPGRGDTVADMANGPKERNLVYPETVELLMKLGSENSNNCRASTCVIKTLPGKPEGQ